MQHGHTAWIRSMDMQHGHSARKRGQQHGYADMQHKCSMKAAWTYNMDTQHGHGHAAWTWTCNMDMDMQHRPMDMDMESADHVLYIQYYTLLVKKRTTFTYRSKSKYLFFGVHCIKS